MVMDMRRERACKEAAICRSEGDGELVELVVIQQVDPFCAHS